MSIDTRTWLASYFKTTPKFVEEMLKDENATTYLLIWPIFEQTLFGGFMKKADIQDVAQTYAPYYDELNIDCSVQHFYDRYQDSELYRHLRHDDNYGPIDTILENRFDELSEKEKLVLIIYVVYRYRNNIFHGNKGIKSWNNYTRQIELCLYFMMSILDCAEIHKGEVI